jgi:hypothetical protein
MANDPERPQHWPSDVEPLFIEDMQKLGRNKRNELFWDGKPIVTRNQYVFTNYQRALAILAIIASVATILTGLNNAAVFMCGRGVDWLGCPLLPQPAAAKIFLELPPTPAPAVPGPPKGRAKTSN